MEGSPNCKMFFLLVPCFRSIPSFPHSHVESQNNRIPNRRFPNDEFLSSSFPRRSVGTRIPCTFLSIPIAIQISGGSCTVSRLGTVNWERGVNPSSYAASLSWASTISQGTSILFSLFRAIRPVTSNRLTSVWTFL